MVYIDDMNAPFGRMKMCHMIADTAVELHEMAAKVGVARKWYQGDHYDVSLSMKKKALALGAKEVGMKELCLMNSKRHWLKDDSLPLVTVEEGRELIRSKVGLPA